MATTKPRISVMLEPAIYGLITRIGAHRKKSAAHVIRELLEPSEGVLREIADALDRVALLDDDKKRQAVREAARAMRDQVQNAQVELEGQLSMFEGSEDAPDGPTGPPAAPAEAALPTPASNTGVTWRERSMKS